MNRVFIKNLDGCYLTILETILEILNCKNDNKTILELLIWIYNLENEKNTNEFLWNIKNCYRLFSNKPDIFTEKFVKLFENKIIKKNLFKIQNTILKLENEINDEKFDKYFKEQKDFLSFLKDISEKPLE